MVKQIELYCISNGYDVMSVAAVPGHGESFWKSNGFEMRYEAPTKTQNKDKKTGHRRNAFLRQHMLAFDDTPLFAKYL